LTNLTRLHLNNNQLTSLPPEIGQLSKLKGIWLRGTLLTFLTPVNVCHSADVSHDVEVTIGRSFLQHRSLISGKFEHTPWRFLL
ncbi:MAG: hypothetical protein D3924_20590, partial [Candidatus Electrothrix sp. AR4]|nr:hypothetical protein [Candidatus Electrothrix sp. AR4]